MKNSKPMHIPPLRYYQLIEMVKFYKPSTILDVGCWNGEHGIQMCKSALSSHSSSVHYTGYDLFEDGSPSLDEKELNSKSRQMHTDISDKFKELQEQHDHRFTFELIKGDTNQVMKEHSVDFAFLDGGHSVGTVQNDYSKSFTSKVIVFDDYFTEDVEGRIPGVSYLGTNVVVDSILDKAKWVFPSNDPVREGGITHLAVIVNEGAAPPNKDILLVPIFVQQNA